VPAVASASKAAAPHAHTTAKSQFSPPREGRSSPFSELLDSPEPRRTPPRHAQGAQRDTQPDEPAPPRDRLKAKSTARSANTAAERQASKPGERDARSESREDSRSATSNNPDDTVDTAATSRSKDATTSAASAIDELAEAVPAPVQSDIPDDAAANAVAIVAPALSDGPDPAAAIAVPLAPGGEAATEAVPPSPADGETTISAMTGRPAPTTAKPAASSQPSTAPDADADSPQTETADASAPSATTAGKPSHATAEANRFAPLAHHKGADASQSAQEAASAKVPDITHFHASQNGLQSGLHAATANHHAVAAGAPQTTAGPAPAPASVPIVGLAVEIAARASGGTNRFEIRLDPPELGKIDVRLDIDKHGHVTSRLIVEKAETLDLLRRDAPQLERALQDAGLKTSGDGLQFSLQQQTPQERNDDDAPAPHTAEITVTDDVVDSTLVQRGYARLAAARGGVDIRI
jgi:hypothetical protein